MTLASTDLRREQELLGPARAGDEAEFGRIVDGHACYQDYRRHLRRTVEEPFALFLSG